VHYSALASDAASIPQGAGQVKTQHLFWAIFEPRKNVSAMLLALTAGGCLAPVLPSTIL
jgi:hypothetical protein